MNIEKITDNAVSVWKDYKRNDPVMLRKSFQMKDSLYKKSDPDKELCTAEFSFNCSFYAAVLWALLLLAGAAVLICGLWHGICRPFRMRKKR